MPKKYYVGLYPIILYGFVIYLLSFFVSSSKEASFGSCNCWPGFEEQMFLYFFIVIIFPLLAVILSKKGYRFFDFVDICIKWIIWLGILSFMNKFLPDIIDLPLFIVSNIVILVLWTQITIKRKIDIIIKDV